LESEAGEASKACGLGFVVQGTEDGRDREIGIGTDLVFRKLPSRRGNSQGKGLGFRV
jgi:hypothetical protein